MKLFLSTLCATCLITSVSFASECEKGKCQKDKDKQEGTVLTDCGKCKKDDGCDKKKDDGCDKKKEGTVLA